MNPIVIIEGPDASGKTTLINTLLVRYPNNCYIHSAVKDDIKALHENAIYTALAAARERHVFIDRLHISDEVYGNIFRGGAQYDVWKYDEELTKTIPNLYKILCLPPMDVCLSKFSERKAMEMYDSNYEVYKAYKWIAENKPEWKVYNWVEDSGKFDLENYRVN